MVCNTGMRLTRPDCSGWPISRKHTGEWRQPSSQPQQPVFLAVAVNGTNRYSFLLSAIDSNSHHLSLGLCAGRIRNSPAFWTWPTIQRVVTWRWYYNDIIMTSLSSIWGGATSEHHSAILSNTASMHSVRKNYSFSWITLTNLDLFLQFWHTSSRW